MSSILLRVNCAGACFRSAARNRFYFNIEPNGMFWAHSFFDNQPMPGSLAAVQQTVAYQWRGEDLAPILSQYPESLWELFRIQARAMRKAREIIYNLAFQPVAGRLAKLLLEQSQGQREKLIERELTFNRNCLDGGFVSTGDMPYPLPVSSRRHLTDKSRQYHHSRFPCPGTNHLRKMIIF